MRDRRPGAAGARPADGGIAAIHFSSSSRSCADCQRSSGSFARHFLTTRSNACGTTHPLGQRGGFRSRIFTMRSPRSSPSNARLPGGQLIEEPTEREDVGAIVDTAATDLFRRHVRKRANEDSYCSQPTILRRRHGRVNRRIHHWRHRQGQSEVEQLRAALGQHDVARLQVAMHDPVPVGARERVTDFDPDFQGLLERDGALLQATAQRLALEVLHHQEVDLVLVTDVEQRADPRMIQCGNMAGLAFEAQTEFGADGHAAPDHLDRHRAIEAGVVRPIDLAHAATADQRHDFVSAEARARRQSQGMSLLRVTTASDFSNTQSRFGRSVSGRQALTISYNFGS